MGIVDEDVARVRAESDFVAIASERMALKKVGRRWTGLCPFHPEKTPSFSLNAEENLFYCLAGETGVLTWDGVRPIRDLAGTTARILTERGHWVDAPFHSYGFQPLRKITLSRNGQTKVIHATPEHRWLVRGGGSARTVRVTDGLRERDQLCWSFPRNRVRLLGDLSPFGIAHGIAFGDGSVFNRAVAVDLPDGNDDQLLKWFPLSRTCQLRTATGSGYLKVLDLPLHFKQRPSLDEAATYLAGWLAGYIAADGHVATDGTCVLDSADRVNLEHVRAVCARLGIGTYGITTQIRTGLGDAQTPLHRIQLVNEDLDDRFILLDEHRRRFQGCEPAGVRRGWLVRSVEPTQRVEEVFCAVVDRTHNFTLEDNILTGNCFGCAVKGDVITFVREIDQLDFVEAVESLAARAGITLRYDDATAGREHQQKGRIHEALDRAIDWYHQRLLSGPDAAAARAYLRTERGYDGALVRRYRMGWAPNGWDHLVRALNLPDQVVRDAGLAFVNRGGRLTDAFRNRLLFPIFDAAGKPVGMGGRILPGGEGPKYKNTAETAVYNKSRILYGLNWAKKAAVDSGEVVVCEGYTDVIGLHAAGVPQAVATCGTALAEGHVRLLTNFARRIVLAYDADSAGQAAAERFYEWERKFDVDIAVAALPAGQDPADLARRDPAALAAAISGAQPFLAFRLDRVLAKADVRSPEGRARAAAQAMAVVAEHPNELIRDQYLMQVADRCQVEPERLRSGAWRSWAAGGGEPSSPGRDERRPGAVKPRNVTGGSEIEALRLAVHRPETVADRLEAVLFDDDLCLGAFLALSAAATLHDAIAGADPEVADLLQRVAVEDTDEDPDDVVIRLIERAGRRALDDLEREARRSAAPEQYGPVIGWMKLALEDLRSGETGGDAEARLVPWLVSRVKVADD